MVISKGIKGAVVGVACVAVMMALGCASICGGPSWLAMETNPKNIEVKIEGIQNGEKFSKVTPFKVELSRSSDYKIIVQTPHYKSEEIVLRRKITGWFWGNLLIGGLIGMGIDGLSGNMWDHNQHVVSLNLETLADAPETVKLNIPVTVQRPNTSYETIFLPVTFHKIKNT
jgi:hypothetical protein